MSDNIFAEGDDAFGALLRKQSFPTVTPTPEQAKRFTEAKSILMWNQPFFASLLYDRMREVYTEAVPTAATDGEAIILNPASMAKLDANEGVFVYAHEIMHGVLAHCQNGHAMKMRGQVTLPDGSTLPYDADMMNRAEDYVINDMLIKSKVGRMPKGGLHRSDITGEMSAIEAYRILHAEAKKKPPGGGQKPGNQPGGGQPCPNGDPGHGGFDIHLSPGSSKGQDPTQAAQQHDEQGWALSVQAAAQAARLQGKLPAGIDRLVQEMAEPPVDWRDHIQGFMARSLGGGGWDFMRGDRRLLMRRPDPIYAPSRSGYGCGTVVAAVDTSGSIGETELSMFFGCMAGILGDCKPRRLVVMFCDAKVHRVDELEDAGELHDLRLRGAPGGGGTSFIPVFDEVREMGITPDALVYLTDMYGSAPDKAPEYPVLWAKLPGSGSGFGWGDEVDIPEIK
jgi:predicted metal-dependent peptidase